MKDNLSQYDQLTALDLGNTYPLITNPDRYTRVGVRVPTMGEVRLLLSVVNGESVPDNVLDYYINLVDHDPNAILEINSWNKTPTEAKQSKSFASIVVGSLSDRLAVKFNRFQDHARLYKNLLQESVINMGLAKIQASSRLAR